jgi:hypothetical protein
MDKVGGHHVKRSKSGSERQRPNLFLHKWTIDPKDKHINKNKHYHMQPQMQNMLVIMELLYGTQRKKERKRE